MTLLDHDPETARLTALTALRAWTRQRDRMPERRAALLASAWHAGEHNVRELARIADVSRQTVYDDLRAHDIDPRADRGRATTPRYAPLDRDQVTDLAEQMSTVLGPAMFAERPEPLAVAAWMAHRAVTAIAELLPAADAPAEQEHTRDRAELLDTIAYCTHVIRQAVHQQWAAEASPAELAEFTEDDTLTQAEIGERVPVEQATVTVQLPDGMSPVDVRLNTTWHHETDPDGWTRWTSDATPPLAEITGTRHLEIQALLGALAEVITGALHPDLLEER